MKRSLTLLFCGISTLCFSQYHFNKAARFGTGAYYSSVNEAAFDFTGAITIEAWIYPTAVNTDMAICGKNFNTAYMFQLRESGSGAILRFNLAGAFVNGTAIIPLNTWTHVAVTYDGVNDVKFYVNGVNDPVSFGTLSGAIPLNNDEFRIGCDHLGGSPNFFFPGAIDELRIYDAVIPEAQINNQKNVPLGVDYASGTLYAAAEESFRMNVENAADTMRSEVWPYTRMAPHNITLVDFSNKYCPYLDYNSNLIFDGTGTFRIYNNFAGTDLYVGTSLTVEAWAKMDTVATPPGSFMNVFNQSGGTSDYPFGLYFSSAGTVFFDLNEGTDGSVSGGDMSDGRWHHLAGSYEQSSGTLRLYVDGIIVDSLIATGVPPVQSTYSWYVGSIGSSSFATNRMVGSIDEVRLWKNVVRTEAEIRSKMYIGMDASVSDPDIDSLVVFGFDGISRESNVDINQQEPLYYGEFGGTVSPKYSNSKINDNFSYTAPLMRLDVSAYPNEFKMVTSDLLIRDMTPVSDTINFSGLSPADPTSIEVVILANHRYIGDVSFRLKAPDGDVIHLVQASASGCLSNDLVTIFTATADSTASGECPGFLTTLAPFSPAMKPEQSFAPLLTGDPNGNWILEVEDEFAGLQGDLYAWGIRMNAGYVGVEPQNTSLAAYNFPNPFRDQTTLYFELAKAGKVDISVFDQAGRVIYQQQVNDGVMGPNYYTMNLQSLSNGIYHYEIRSGEHKAVGKMVISK